MAPHVAQKGGPERKSISEPDARSLGEVKQLQSVCHLCDSDVKKVNAAFPKPRSFRPLKRGSRLVIRPGPADSHDRAIARPPHQRSNVKRLFLDHMSSTVPPRSLMVFALSLHSTPGVSVRSAPSANASGRSARETGQPIATASKVGVHPSAGCFRFAGPGSRPRSTEGSDRSGSRRANDARSGAEDWKRFPESATECASTCAPSKRGLKKSINTRRSAIPNRADKTRIAEQYGARCREFVYCTSS
jgi:hypothetical protein